MYISVYPAIFVKWKQTLAQSAQLTDTKYKGGIKEKKKMDMKAKKNRTPHQEKKKKKWEKKNRRNGKQMLK